MQIKKQIGNAAFWQMPNKTAYLCSRHIPISRFSESFEWVHSLHPSMDCVVCVRTSYFEGEVLKALLENKIPVILVCTYADAYYENHIAILEALAQKRILIVELELQEGEVGDEVTFRNQFIMAHTDTVVVGYMRERGHLSKMLTGKFKFLYAKDFAQSVAAESTMPEKRGWTEYDDKMLLSNFYQDKSIDYLQQVLRHSFLSIRNRISLLTYSREYRMGVDFEAYVLQLLQVRDRSDLLLREWRGDKSMDGVVPESNKYPDLVLRQTVEGHRFDYAVECKWRSGFSSKSGLVWTDFPQFESYKYFSRSHNIPVFIVLGLGGLPTAPDAIYVIPLDTITSCRLNKKAIKRYQSPLPTSPLIFDVESKTLKSSATN